MGRESASKLDPCTFRRRASLRKLRSEALLKFINITKILILHGGEHNVGVNGGVDALELIQNNSMRTRAKCGAIIHVDAVTRKRSVRSPSLLPFAVVVNTITQGRTASFNDSNLRKEYIPS